METEIATRYQPRARGQSFLDRQNGGPSDSESDTRRKISRIENATTDSTGQFRKPSLPASATRQSMVGNQRQTSSGSINFTGDGMQRRPSLTNMHKRRVSAVTRDTARVPSGPREFPGASSPSKRNAAQISNLPSSNTSINPPRRRPSLLPAATSESNFNQPELSRGAFANPVDDSAPGTPASTRARDNSGSLDFLPAVNFDELHTSITALDAGNARSDVTLDDFPAVGGGGGRVLRSDTAKIKAMAAAANSSIKSGRPSQDGDDDRRASLTRGESFRQRLADRSSKAMQDTRTNNTQSFAGNDRRISIGARNKRQSIATSAQPTDSQPLSKSTSKPSRPNLFTSTSSQSDDLKAYLTNDSTNDLNRSSSLIKARRTTINPVSTSTFGTASVTAPASKSKTKSFLTSPHDDLNTPTNKSSGKSSARAHTPSSSGNGRRQSMASGRASGLGARTISPTDARRLKRMSVAPQQPPLPSTHKSPSTPGEDMPPAPSTAAMQQHLQGLGKFADLPRLTSAPSPSLIPSRKTSSSLASNSARVSPNDLSASKFGYPFPVPSSTPGVLSNKSSFASLHTASSGGGVSNQSRVPIPKSRSTQTGNPTTQSNTDEVRFGGFIPPVPAIPKGYESPKDAESSPHGQFLAGAMSRKSSAAHSAFDESMLDQDGVWLGVPFGEPVRSSFDSDRTKFTKRKSTFTNTGIGSAASQPHLLSKLTQDGDGRQNGSLQPLRLPPLNLQPFNTSNNSRAPQMPRPSQELAERDRPVLTGAQTPDWARQGQKTPSTPMTASKATFFKRHGDENKNGVSMRSSTSHFGLRDAMGIDSDKLRTEWLDDLEDVGNGVPIPAQSRNFSRGAGATRNAITPFASGSLPKGSGEFARLQHATSDDFSDDHNKTQFDGMRLAKIKSMDSRPSLSSNPGRSLSKDDASYEQDTRPSQDVERVTNGKKEGGSLKRRLSLGWRRSGSKAANHSDKSGDADQQSSPKTSSMLPPKLPASIAFTGDGSLGISTSARPSMEGVEPTKSDFARRKSAFAGRPSADLNSDREWQAEAKTKSEIPSVKTKSVHSERPQVVNDARATSWSNNRFNVKSNLTQPKPPKHGHTASTISALIKDHDDLAADEEMRKLTQKKKEVDNVAKVTEELMRRASPKDALTLEHVLHDRHHPLNIFERGEIVEYEADGVYFTGSKNAKKIVGSLAPASLDQKKNEKSAQNGNYGYDDERGDYNIVLGDHLAYRYEVCDVLGKGSFGQVVRCIDHKEGGVVAVKIIRNKKRFHQQALVEVGILGKLREWDPTGAHATLSITGSFYFRSHLCIVTPCLSINLYELVRAHNFSGFNLRLIRRFARQLLACLVLLQQKRVIHCDLKPENILLCSARAADIRVIDFGSSCREEEKVYTYIQSRFYRSPEVILGSSYGLGIDMWSFGCILAEMLTGFPIFPGENEQEQLACIMEIFGPPDRHLVERCTRKKLFFDSVGKPRVTVSSKGRRRRPSSKTLQQALKTDDEAFLDFVAKCLRWDPDRRLKPNEACMHPFITNQPFHQRPGIPDEARRAARVRSTAVAPTSNGASSPVKRSIPQPQSQVASTPQKATVQQVAPTPQTAVRAPISHHHASNSQSSPAKPIAARRQSNIASAGSAAALANKRMSSGVSLPPPKPNNGMGSLAEKAARESMASTSTAASVSSNTGRWRV